MKRAITNTYTFNISNDNENSASPVRPRQVRGQGSKALPGRAVAMRGEQGGGTATSQSARAAMA